jgi:RND family efflux transporter MFP subunit
MEWTMSFRRTFWISTLLTLGAATACTGGSKASLPPVKKAPDEAPKAKPAEPAVESAEKAVPSEAPASVVADAPKTGDVAPAQEFRLTGQVEAPRRSQIAFRVTGFISGVTAAAGTRAAKGEVLASVDDRDFVLRVELARARRDQAKVGLDSAKKEWSREQELKKDNASTAAVLEKVQAAFDQSRLGLKLAEIDLEQAELALKDTRLVAPYDCVVATQLKDEGEYVQSGNAVFEVFDTGEPEVTLEAPERLLGKVEAGAKLAVLVPSVGYSGDAEVVRVVPVIAEKTRTFGVTAKLLKSDARVVPGSYAEALIK